MIYEALHLRDRRYAVRPEGVCGTHGWKNGVAWGVVYVNARDASEALRKAIKARAKRGTNEA